MTSLAPDPSRPRDDDEGRPRGRTRPWWPWAWMTLACTFLLVSGAARAWQGRRAGPVEASQTPRAFPLQELPRSVESWQDVGGQETLDPQIAQIAGSDDSLVRTYRDRQTGVAVTVLVLHGRARAVTAHTPEACYPALGYEPVREAVTVPLNRERAAAQFRSLWYEKKGGSAVHRVEVYYAFRHNGGWSPDADGRDVRPVFKVQVERRLAENEQRVPGNPCEQFLSLFLREIEQRLASGPVP